MVRKGKILVVKIIMTASADCMFSIIAIGRGEQLAHVWIIGLQIGRRERPVRDVRIRQEERLADI